MPYKAAIIGCGALGKQHAQAWHDRKDAEVAAVFDPEKDRAAELAQKMGIKTSPSLKDAIKRKGVNVVSLCTPVCYHAEIACLAMKAGCHVICEKPLALTEEQARKMIETAESEKKKLVVSYQYRGFAHFRAYKTLFESGALGSPLFLRFTDIREVRPKLAMHAKSKNGGPIIDMAGHFFDLFSFITGCLPDSVYARGHVYGQGKKRLEAINDLAIDAAEILVGSKEGHSLSVYVNWGMPEDFGGEIPPEIITGPKEMLTRQGQKIIRYKGGKEKAEIGPLGSAFQGPEVRIEDLIEAIEKDKKPEVGGPEGLTALRVSLGALKSIETGQAVKL